MKISYNWLQTFFDDPLPSIEEIDQKLALHSFETEGIENFQDDFVLDVDVLPNRAHDSLSHAGIAKEVSVLFNLPLKKNRYEQSPSQTTTFVPEIEVLETLNCNRYALRAIENVQVKESPAWLQNSLLAIGQKPINNLVDIANYVMFDLGQPMHVFDSDNVAQKKLILRNAQKGEQMMTLSGMQANLTAEDFLITDTRGILGLAGIKGGIKAEVTNNTASIILEAANFNPQTTRKSAKRHNLSTDASKRFENQPTPEIALEAIHAATALIMQIAQTAETKVGEIVDWYPNQKKNEPITVTLEEINRLLGTEIKIQEAVAIFNSLDIETNLEGSTIIAIPPSKRLDLVIKEDLIEEVGRLFGYEKITSVQPKAQETQINPLISTTLKIRSLLIQQGFSEIITYSFLDTGTVEMENALAQDKNFLRDQKGMERLIQEKLELNAKYTDLFDTVDTKIFEMGTIFEGLEQEVYILALGIQAGNKKTKIEKELKAVLELLQNELGLKTELGKTLQADSGKIVYTLRLDNILDQIKSDPNYEVSGLEYKEDRRRFFPYSKFPYITRDVAVWLPKETNPEKLTQLLQSNAGELLLKEPTQFDTFTKGEKTSYAYRLIFQSNERTLTDAEINPIMQKIEREIKAQGWEVR